MRRGSIENYVTCKTMPKIKSKLPHVGTTIFSVMSKMAREYGAINLSQGFPDFDCDERLKELVDYYIKNGYNQYAPMPGVPELRKAISKRIHGLYGQHFNEEDEITITAGATQAIFTALGALVRPHDEVIIFSPAYDCYAPAVELFGGRCIDVPLKNDFSLDLDLLKKSINNRTRAIVLNSPHNPSGTIISKEELKELGCLVKNTDIIVISDEVYEHIVYDSKAHFSVCMVPDLSARSYIISSFGKTYHNTGWKLGYCYASKELTKEFRKIHQYNVFCVNKPCQHAFADYMQEDESHLRLSAFYQKKRDFFTSLLEGSRMKVSKCEGTYFQLIDYNEVSTENDVEFANWLCREKGLATIPLSPFYQNNSDLTLLRICFAKDDKTLEAGARILKGL